MKLSKSKSNRKPRDAYWRVTLIFALGCLVAVTSFGAGLLMQRDVFSKRNAGSTADGTDGFARFDDVRTLIEREYFGEPDEPTAEAQFNQTLEYAAIQGMMGTLDKFSTFLVPSAQTASQDQLSGEYEGIGVWIDVPDGKLTIVAPIPDSPAEAAGLKAGDVIVSVDGTPITADNVATSMDLVRGPEGSTVHLMIVRSGAASPIEIDVVREKIPVQSVNYRMMSGEKLAYIQVTVFGDKTTPELDMALKQAQTDGATGIILDLRNNGGGWVQSAQEMIGRFVDSSRGPALYEDLNADGSGRTSQPIIPGDINMFEIPLVVLVNGGTASASEIVSGALRDYGRATIVGEQTYGKGSVQRVHDFDDGTSAHITFAEWLTPKLSRLQGQGIRPDVVVKQDANDPNHDTQLEAAITLLQSSGTPIPALSSPVASVVSRPIGTPDAVVGAIPEPTWGGETLS